MANIIKARRKLSDLYKTGVEIRFGGRYGLTGAIAEKREGPFVDADGTPIPLNDDEVAIWVQPPNPLHREQALRDAQGARARALVRAKREKDSEEHLTVMAFIADMSDETLFDYVLQAESESRRNEAMRDVLALEEWSDITAYQDAMRKFEGMSEEELQRDPEWHAMAELDEKFAEQVAEREKSLAVSGREMIEMLGRPNAEKKALEKRSDIVGSQAFMKEYERQMLFYSSRDAEDHGVLFFESATELAGQPDEVRDLIGEALQPFISDGAEAKNSPGAASGSDSSELPSKPETSEVSTPEVPTE